MGHHPDSENPAMLGESITGLKLSSSTVDSLNAAGIVTRRHLLAYLKGLLVPGRVIDPGVKREAREAAIMVGLSV